MYGLWGVMAYERFGSPTSALLPSQPRAPNGRFHLAGHRPDPKFVATNTSPSIESVIS